MKHKAFKAHRITSKYLFPAALLILVAFCAFFYFAFGNMQWALVEEKIADRILYIDVVCDEITYLSEILNEVTPSDYKNVITRMVEALDKNSKTILELFDGGLHSISQRYPIFPDTPFVIYDFPVLVQEMMENEYGEMTVYFDKPGVPAHDLHVYYRWVHTGAGHGEGDDLLLVVGISKFTLENDIGKWVEYGAIMLILVAAVFITASVIVLCNRTYIFSNAKRGQA